MLGWFRQRFVRWGWMSQRQVQRILAEKIADLQAMNAELQKNEELART